MANTCVSNSNRPPFSVLQAFVVDELQSARRETCERLKAGGLFAANKQLELPWDFNSVLVVSGVGAPGLTDFFAEANRLQQLGLCSFRFVACQLQGVEIARALCETLQLNLETWSQTCAAPPDAVLIVQGDDDAGDLMWLDDFKLARYVGDLSIPVWTGIIHGPSDNVLEQVVQQRFDSPSLLLSGVKQRMADRAAEAEKNFISLNGLIASGLQRSKDQMNGLMTSISTLGRAHTVDRQQVTAPLLDKVSQGANRMLDEASASSAELMRVILERAESAKRSNIGPLHD